MKQAKFLSNSHLYLCAGLLSVVVIGCGREEIRVYSAPKDTSNTKVAAAAQPHASPMSSTSLPGLAAAKAPVSWKTPAGWEELAPTSMRVGNFSVAKGDQKAEIAILPFPGQVGGELENVNRWRGEVGLDPVKEGEYEAQNVQIGSEQGRLFDLPGPKLGTVAAMIERDGVSWFFKMRGDKELVAATKPSFVEFLKTISFEKSTTPPPASPVANAAPLEEEGESQTSDEPGPKWQTAKHWKQGPQKPMVVRNWDVTGENNKSANIAISSFPGDVGGVVANVNRWRGQLGLPPWSEKEVRDSIKVMETTDGHSQAMYVDLTGKDRNGEPARMISAIVPHGDSTWFYKITGDPGLVEKEKTAFLKMVQTANFH